MKSVPGISMSRDVDGPGVICRCGSLLTILAPGEAVYPAGRGQALGTVRTEEKECAGCGSTTRLEVTTVRAQ